MKKSVFTQIGQALNLFLNIEQVVFMLLATTGSVTAIVYMLACDDTEGAAWVFLYFILLFLFLLMPLFYIYITAFVPYLTAFVLSLVGKKVHELSTLFGVLSSCINIGTSNMVLSCFWMCYWILFGILLVFEAYIAAIIAFILIVAKILLLLISILTTLAGGIIDLSRKEEVNSNP